MVSACFTDFFNPHLDQVWLIHLELADLTAAAPTKLPLDDLNLFVAASLESFESIAEHHGIEIAPDQSDHLRPGRVAKASRVTAVFSDDHTMDSISVATKQDPVNRDVIRSALDND